MIFGNTGASQIIIAGGMPIEEIEDSGEHAGVALLCCSLCWRHEGTVINKK